MNLRYINKLNQEWRICVSVSSDSNNLQSGMIIPFLPYQYYWSGILACQNLIYQVTNGFANEMNVPILTEARLFGIAVMNHKDSPTLAPYECNEWRMTGHYFSEFCMKSNHYRSVVPNHGYCLMLLLIMTNAIDIMMLITAFLFSDDSNFLIFSTDFYDYYPTVQYLLVKVQLTNVIYIPLMMMMSSNGNIFRDTGPLCGTIHQSLVNSPHIGRRRGALIFSLIPVWING